MSVSGGGIRYAGCVLFLLLISCAAEPALPCLAAQGSYVDDEFRVYDLAWSPTDDLLFTGSMTLLRMFSVSPDGAEVALLDEEASDLRYNSVLWTADGQHLIAPTGDAVRLYAVDAAAGSFEEVARSAASGVEYNRAALSPDGRHLLACDRDGRTELHALSFDPPEITLLAQVQAHQRCTRVSWSPSGQMGMSAGLEGDLQLYQIDADAGTLAVSDTLSFPVEVGDGIWTRDDRWAVGGLFEAPFDMWYLSVDPDAVTFEVAQTIEGHLSGVSALEMDPSGDLLITGDHDHTIHLYQHTPGEGLSLLYNHPDDGVGVHSARLSRDGSLMARTASTIDRLDILQTDPRCFAP